MFILTACLPLFRNKYESTQAIWNLKMLTVCGQQHSPQWAGMLKNPAETCLLRQKIKVEYSPARLIQSQ